MRWRPALVIIAQAYYDSEIWDLSHLFFKERFEHSVVNPHLNRDIRGIARGLLNLCRVDRTVEFLGPHHRQLDDRRGSVTSLRATVLRYRHPPSLRVV